MRSHDSSVSRFDRITKDSWKAIRKDIPGIILGNTLLLLFLLTGASLVDMIYALFAQFLVIGAFVPLSILRHDAYRKEQRTVPMRPRTLREYFLKDFGSRSAEYVPLTKGYAVRRFIMLFLGMSVFIGSLLVVLFGLPESSPIYFAVSLLLFGVYEWRIRVMDLYEGKRTLSRMGERAYMAIMPLILLTFIAGLDPTRAIPIPLFLIVKVLFDIFSVYAEQSRIRTDTMLAQGGY